MKAFAPLWLALTAASVFAEEVIPRAMVVVEGDPTAAAAEAVSRTRQFRVTGGDGAARGLVALLADETRDELRTLMEEKQEEEVKVPIRVILAGAPGDPLPPRPVVMELFYDDIRYDLRVHAHLGRGIERERMAGVLTTALIYERTLRNRKPGGEDDKFDVRPWLVDGLREAAAWRQKKSDRRAYEALFKRGGIYKMDQLFSVDEAARNEMDAAMRLAFQVSSGALVMALLEQPQGKEGFRSFLGEVAGFGGEMPVLLRKHFPELNLSETSLSKWWALQMANKGAAPLSDSLSVQETEASLNDLLKLHVRAEDGMMREKPLAAWEELSAMKPEEKVEAVRPAQDGLVRLSYRCFPSYRPVLLEYQSVLSAIEHGKTKKVAEQLSSLEASRGLMLAKAERARDFLDWFEITRARETSGVFDDYLRLKDGLQERKHRRNDPISDYLDRADALFKHGQQTPRVAAPPLLLPP